MSVWGDYFDIRALGKRNVINMLSVLLPEVEEEGQKELEKNISGLLCMKSWH